MHLGHELAAPFGSVHGLVRATSIGESVMTACIGGSRHCGLDVDTIQALRATGKQKCLDVQ
jgi:hypothetical protein